MERTHKDKIKEAGIRRYGTEEAWREAMRVHGAKANRTTPRGLKLVSKEKASEIGKKGAAARWAKKPSQENDA